MANEDNMQLVAAPRTNSPSTVLWTCFRVDEDTTDFGYEGTVLYLCDVEPVSDEINLIQASWYGKYGWTTWMASEKEALQEAMASKSRGISTAEGLKALVWLLYSLEIDSIKAYELLIQNRAVAPAIERNGVKSWRIYDDVVLKEFKYRKHLMRVEALNHDHWADVQIGTFHKDTGSNISKECEETHDTWAGYCSVCWRENLHSEELHKVRQQHLLEYVKECRYHSVQEIAAHEGLFEEQAVINFLANVFGYVENSNSSSSSHMDLSH